MTTNLSVLKQHPFLVNPLCGCEKTWTGASSSLGWLLDFILDWHFFSGILLIPHPVWWKITQYACTFYSLFLSSGRPIWYGNDCTCSLVWSFLLDTVFCEGFYWNVWFQKISIPLLQKIIGNSDGGGGGSWETTFPKGDEPRTKH